MFSLLKLIIWIAGVIAIAYFVLPYFGYALNVNYWNESKATCQEKLNQCQKDIIQTGFNDACDWKCVDPRLIVRKQDGKDDILEEEN